jgi:hypothetical protein
LPPKLPNGDDGAIGAGAGFGAGFFAFVAGIADDGAIGAGAGFGAGFFFFVAGIAFFIFFLAGIAFFIAFFLRGRGPRLAFLDFFATFNLPVCSTKITPNTAFRSRSLTTYLRARLINIAVIDYPQARRDCRNVCGLTNIAGVEVAAV